MNLRISSSLSAILGLTLLAAPLPARAQTVTGTIQGTVTDTSGGVVARRHGHHHARRHRGPSACRRDDRAGFYSRAVPADRPLQRHRRAQRLRHRGPHRGHRRRPERHARRRPRSWIHGVDARGHGDGRRAAHQPDQRRGQGVADRRADHGQADAQRRQLPVAGGDLHRVPGESDRRAEQSDRVVRARRSISTAPARAARRSRSTASTTTTRRRTRTGRARRCRRSRSSRCSRTPTPRSSAAATARWCWCRPSPGTNQVHGDRLPVSAGQRPGTPKSFFAAGDAEANPAAHRVRRSRSASRSSRTSCSRSSTSIAPSSDGQNNYRRDLFLPAERAAPRLTRGNDTPANRACHPVDPGPLSPRPTPTIRAAPGPTPASSASTSRMRTTPAASTGTRLAATP